MALLLPRHQRSRARETCDGGCVFSSHAALLSGAGAEVVSFFGGRGLTILSVKSCTASTLMTGRPVESPETNDFIPSIIMTLMAGLTDSICKPGFAAISTGSILTGSFTPWRSIKTFTAFAMREVRWIRLILAGL